MHLASNCCSEEYNIRGKDIRNACVFVGYIWNIKKKKLLAISLKHSGKS